MYKPSKDAVLVLWHTDISRELEVDGYIPTMDGINATYYDISDQPERQEAELKWATLATWNMLKNGKFPTTLREGEE